MAITKLLRLKEGKGANRSAYLKNNIYYICNPEKTCGGRWIGGNAGTTPGVIYKTMMMNKTYWGKEGGSQGFHYVISFPPDLKIDEAFVYRVTEEFCKELLGDSFYYCIAVHNDRDHMHAHITFDSVSKVDGYKFHSPRGDWEKRIQPITDRICEKYGIPTLDYEKDQPKGMDYGSWKDGKEHTRKQKEGKFSWYDVIRDDIDEAIEASDTYEEFLEKLKEQHYEIRDKKYLSLRPYGKDRSVRFMRLGEEYTRERIIQRIGSPKKGAEFKRYGNYKKESETIRRYTKEKGSPSEYQKRFYYRYICTINIRHPVFADRDNWRYKKDVMDLFRYSRQVSYVFAHNIRSRNDAEEKRISLQEALRQIQKEKKKLRIELGSGSNYYRMKQLLSIQEELKRFPEGSCPDLMEAAEDLIRDITCGETLDECLDRYNSVNKVLDDLGTAAKQVREELLVVDGILGMEDVDHGYMRYRGGGQDDVRRITVNRKSCAENIRTDGFRIFRIPGTSGYVQVPLKDTVKLSEEAVSALIHMKGRYPVLDETGAQIRTESGRELMKRLDDRRQRKTMNFTKTSDSL